MWDPENDVGAGPGAVRPGEGDPAWGARRGARQGKEPAAAGAPLASFHLPHAASPRSQVALAVALDLRTFLRLRPCAEGRVCVRLPGVGVLRSWDIPSLQALRSGFAGKRWEEDPAAPVGSRPCPVTQRDPGGYLFLCRMLLRRVVSLCSVCAELTCPCTPPAQALHSLCATWELPDAAVPASGPCCSRVLLVQVLGTLFYCCTCSGNVVIRTEASQGPQH